MKFARDTGLLFQRATQQMLRNPAWLFVGFITPVLYLALFTPLLRAVRRPRPFHRHRARDVPAWDPRPAGLRKRQLHRMVAELGLKNVTVVQGDALSSGLAAESFDLVHERLVMVNVPERIDLLAEMLSLVSPGGLIALEDIDNISWVCEPAHESWTTLLGAFHETFRSGGGDPFIGRRLPTMLRQAGVVDVQVHVQADLPQPGEYRRTHLVALIESIRDKVIGSGTTSEADLNHHRAALLDHLADPTTLLIDKLLVQCWGRKPAQITLTGIVATAANALDMPIASGFAVGDG